MNTSQNILVCVTQQKTCERLIFKAENMRKELGGKLFVIHVTRNEWNFLDNVKEGEALEYLFSISKSIGATLTVLKSDDITGTIANFAKDNKIGRIIMGGSPNNRADNNFLQNLQSILNDVEITIVP